MVIKSEIDIENLCTCREARRMGKDLRPRRGGGIALVEGAEAGDSSDAGTSCQPARSPTSLPGQENHPRSNALRPANRPNCSSSCRRISTRPSRAAK